MVKLTVELTSEHTLDQAVKRFVDEMKTG